nr:streptolysin O, SLO {N-terminal, large fragment} [Streptococcus equisimilis, group C, H46A, Peptide Partial, 15 aa] [Streptococcus dysgalactiae subsp. equisimilis]
APKEMPLESAEKEEK